MKNKPIPTAQKEEIKLKAVGAFDHVKWEDAMEKEWEDLIPDSYANMWDFQYDYTGPFPEHTLTTDFSDLIPEGCGLITDFELDPFCAYSVYVEYKNKSIRILCDPDQDTDQVSTEEDNSLRILTGTLVRTLQDALTVIQRNNLDA